MVGRDNLVVGVDEVGVDTALDRLGQDGLCVDRLRCDSETSIMSDQ